MSAACARPETAQPGAQPIEGANPDAVCGAVTSELLTRAQLLGEETRAQAGAADESGRRLMVEDREFALASLGRLWADGAIKNEAGAVDSDRARSACVASVSPLTRTSGCGLVAGLMEDLASLCRRGVAQLGALESRQVADGGGGWLVGVRASRSCSDLDRSVRLTGGVIAMMRLGEVEPPKPADCSRLAPQAAAGLEVDNQKEVRVELDGLTSSARRLASIYRAGCADVGGTPSRPGLSLDEGGFCVLPQKGP